MSQENHPKPLKVLWEQLLGEDVSHCLQGCFAENEENKALFHGLPHKMLVLGNVLSPFFICFSFRNRNTSLVVFVNQRRCCCNPRPRGALGPPSASRPRRRRSGPTVPCRLPQSWETHPGSSSLTPHSLAPVASPGVPPRAPPAPAGFCRRPPPFAGLPVPAAGCCPAAPCRR